MGGSWQQVQLQDIVTILGDGLHGTPRYDESGDYYFINGNNLENGQIVVREKTKKISYDEFLKHRKNLNNRTLLVSINGTIGNVAYYDGEKVILGKSACYFNLIDDVEKGFVRYILASHFFQNYLHQNATGTTIKNVSLKDMRTFSFMLPPRQEQKAIAHILGTLDDKIELNRRMNAALEAMARALFKSWFVDFDPVIDNALAAGNPIPEPLQTRAKARKALGDQRKPLPEAIQKQFPSRFVFTEEMGWVPEGWEVKKIGEILELAYGKSLPATKRSAGDIPVYGSGGMSGFHNEKLVDGPGVVIGRKGTVGSMYWVDGDFFPIDTVFYVVNKINVPLYWLYQSLQLIDIKSMGADSAVPGVNRNAVYARSLAIPAKIIFDVYLTQVDAYNSRNKALSGQSETLSGLRDTLLPKLISGQLRIPDAEKLVTDAL